MSITAVIPPPAPLIRCNPENVASLALPFVLLWDPLQQYSPYFCDGITCPQCSKPLKRRVYWKCGQSSGLQPRVVHCIEYTVLVVPAVYSCEYEHTVSSTDPSIVNVLRWEQHPFVLLHRTGFTKHFINTIITLLQEGMTISRIELFIAKCRKDYVAHLYLRLKSVLPQGYPLTITVPPLNIIQSPVPSNDVICKCFIAHYLEHRKLYDSSMQMLTANSYISFDHTFKVASNIGFQRADNRWITQYNSVFFVMNEIGQVIAWQLAKSTSIDEVELLLNRLTARLTTASLPVYIDNCCQLREKLTNIMGTNVLVKLDLFHAVQRITRTISKKHPYFYQCMADLKLVFRQPNDFGSMRKLSTPDSSVMSTNLDSFVRKWEACTHGEWNIITENTKKEVSSLKKHAMKGCLSDIPVGAGTTRNEAFHRILNTHFGRLSRIGIPLALALLTVLIYQHNCKLQEKVTGEPQLPLSLLKERFSSSDASIECFGVVSKTNPEDDDTSWITCKFSELESKIDSTMNVISLSDEVAELIAIQDLFQLIQNACSLVQLADTMKKVTSNSPIFKPALVPFMTSVSNVILSKCQELSSSTTSEVEHLNRLSHLISACKLQLHPVSRDGNCMFTAVALVLKKNEKSILQHDPNFFASKGLKNDDVSILGVMLRKLTVEEWKSHEDEYQCLLTSSTVAEEADKFMYSGYYHGELADTMPKALSNALDLIIVVVTSIKDMPIMNIVPRRVAVPVLLFVAFNQFGPGHYDGLTIKTDNEDKESDTPKQIEITYCTCGKNDRKGSTYCHPKTRRYSTTCLCPCYNNKRGCSENCKCKFCENTFGKRDVDKSLPGARKRPRHNWQLPVLSSAAFALQEGEILNHGSRSLLEFFILEQIFSYCIKHKSPMMPNDIDIIYNAVVELCTNQESSLPLSKLSLDKINTFLREHDHNAELFESLCVTHLQLQYKNNIN